MSAAGGDPRALAFAATLCALASGSLAAAHETVANLDLFRGSVVSDTRVVGLAGAYVGIGEGQIGQPSNEASLAQRRPNLQHNLDWDWVFVYPFPFVVPVNVNNDAAEAQGYVPALNLQLGISGQYRSSGLGIHLDVASLTLPNQTSVGSATWSIGFAQGFWLDQILVGAALLVDQARVCATGDCVGYQGYGVQASALIRPLHHHYRIGVDVRPPVWLQSQGSPITIGDCSTVECLTLRWAYQPWQVAAGASYRFGPGWGDYNRLPPVARREAIEAAKARGEETPLDTVSDDTPAGPYLFSFEILTVGPAPNGVGMAGALQKAADPSRPIPPTSGAFTTLTPRAGFEWEPFYRRFRLRAGLYYEPSRYTEGTSRLHATASFDLRVLWEIRVSAGGDVAQNYANLFAGLGFWWP